MSIYLAAFALHGRTLDEATVSGLKGALARAGTAALFRSARCAVAHVDLGLWPGNSARTTETAFTVFGGDPVLSTHVRTWPRDSGVITLGERLLAEGPTAARDAEGTYAGLVFDFARSELLAVTDKVGVRPVYWQQTADHVFVASSFWALHAMTVGKRTPDWRAAAETAAFGFPMGNRTLLTGVNLLSPGHVLLTDTNGAREVCYWDWRSLPTLALHGDALDTFVTATFNEAVDRRLGNANRAMAFLSGGMDSRLLVTRLRTRGVETHTLNFAPEGSQDLAFGRLAAQVLGTRHFEFGGMGLEFYDRRSKAMETWARLNPELARTTGWPSLVWSGDGGSTTLGKIYLTPAIVETARHGNQHATAQAIAIHNKALLSRRIFRGRWKGLANLPVQSVQEALADFQRFEPGRNCHLFFMLNGQRRLLAKHFETIHQSRLDYVLPFFDGRFVAAVLSTPVDEYLLHRLYNRIMAKAPLGAGQVPWQAYPGHERCPVPIEPGLRRQWEDGWMQPEHIAQRRATDAARWQAALDRPSTADELLAKPVLRAALLFVKRNWLPLDYLLAATDPFYRAADYASQ